MTLSIYFKCLIIFFLFISCHPTRNNPYAILIRNHKVSHLYNSNLETSSWEKRVFNLTDDYLDYVQKLNQIDGIVENTTPLTLKELEVFRKEFQKIANQETEIVKRIKDKYIHGIFLCKNLGSTGISGFIKKENRFIGGFVVLDITQLREANEWISYKENTVFSLNYLKIKVQIESVEENLLHNGIDYILLHELGHIISTVEGFVPSFDLEYRDFRKASFTSLDWLDETVSIHDSKIPKRSEIKFYSKPTLQDEDVIPIYTALEETPFPTLYASINADEHFSESFVSYVHLYIKKKPWVLRVVKDGNVVHEMGNGITQERCKKVRDIIEKILKF